MSIDERAIREDERAYILGLLEAEAADYAKAGRRMPDSCTAKIGTAMARVARQLRAVPPKTAAPAPEEGQ